MQLTEQKCRSDGIAVHVAKNEHSIDSENARVVGSVCSIEKRKPQRPFRSDAARGP